MLNRIAFGWGLRRDGDLSGASGKNTYTQKVLSVCGANLLAYWRQNESSGTSSLDASGNGRNGTYTGVTLGQSGIGDGLTCPSFDGTTSFNNVYSAGLAGAFNGAEGTMACWAKVSGAGVWTDSTTRMIASLGVNGNNELYINRSSTNNTLQGRYTAGATGKTVNSTAVGGVLAFFHLAITWNKAGDAFKFYINGVQTGATQTGLGTWAGTPSNIRCVVGAYNTTPSSVFSGFVAHALVCNRALTASEIAQLATV